MLTEFEAAPEMLASVASLLGGTKILKHRLATRVDAHDLVVRGIPRAAARHLIGSLVRLDSAEWLGVAIGMSTRTLQRHKAAPDKPLNPEQSARALKFAEILAKATRLFGSQDEAEAWLARPAIGLDQRRPVDLMASSVGAGLVEEHLDRLEMGVYA